MIERVGVRVPTTSANLGPGFDTLGIALGVYDELDVRLTPGVPTRVIASGEGAGEVPDDETNLVARSLAHVFEDAGVPVPSVEIRATNRIPHGRGMGSSGAAVVAGLLAGATLRSDEEPLDGDTLLRLATEIEGHPDNVAPALFGGLTIAWLTPAGPRSQRLGVHRGVSPLVLVPESTMSTSHARSLQPAQVPREDAVFNVSRSALLIAAMTQTPELLLAATEDRLHQHYRAAAMPQTAELIAVLRERGFPAVVSGAGPSVLVLADGPGVRAEAKDVALAAFPTGWAALSLAVDVRGAQSWAVD